MKYINAVIFLSLIALVTGCQKKEQTVAEKNHKKPKVARRGPTKLQTRKSVN